MAKPKVLISNKELSIISNVSFESEDDILDNPVVNIRCLMAKNKFEELAKRVPGIKPNTKLCAALEIVIKDEYLDCIACNATGNIANVNCSACNGKGKVLK